jgi:histidine ammonia-lyase
MYIHSIPNNNDNQDIVSMGANAALLTRKVIDNSFEVLSIQLMSALQAVDAIACQEKLAPVTRAVYNRVREIFPTFVDDHPKYKEQKKVKELLEQSSPLP